MSDISDNVILSWVGELDELEQQIEDLQAAKRDFYAGIRDQHGKATAAGLKAAMRVHRMDSEKRLAADEVDDEAQRILAVIAKGPSRTRAPRATREDQPATPPHDPETGEVDEPAAPVPAASVQPAQCPPMVVGALGASVEIDYGTARPPEAPAAASASAEPFTPPAFLTGERKSIRPNCLNPGNCAGYGSNHCHTCKKAAESKEAA